MLTSAFQALLQTLQTMLVSSKASLTGSWSATSLSYRWRRLSLFLDKTGEDWDSHFGNIQIKKELRTSISGSKGSSMGTRARAMGPYP